MAFQLADRRASIEWFRAAVPARILNLLWIAACAAGCLLATAGCLGSAGTTLELVNETGFPVDVQLFYDDDQELTEALLELDGTEFNETVPAGTAVTVRRSCDDFQALFIKDADMRVAPGISPEASTRVYREPGDFGCGDIVRFTFTTNVFSTELDISFASEQP